MVSYRDPGNLKVAVDYLIGKAAAHGPFVCRELRLTGGEGAHPIAALIAHVSNREDAAIYVVFVEGRWTAAQLQGIDRVRDRLANLQMLWFVEHDALLRYLPQWPQFRQLLRFYTLEDDFLAALTRDEINADLAVLSDLPGPKDQGLKRLRRVLDYLKTAEGRTR
jgi:hypothetical protein